MAEDNIQFGSEDGWSFNRATNTFDISRGSERRLTVATTKGYDKETSFTVDPDKSALVIVDMQNFFLDPKCRSHPLGLQAVERTIAAIKKCRESGMQVIWLNWGLTDEDLETMPPSVLCGFSKALITAPQTATHRGLGSDMGDGMGRVLFRDSWNADIYSALKTHARPDDIHCAKNRISGMWSREQPLWRHLGAAGKQTLLFAGVNTDQCVLGTLSSAYNAGWDVVMVEDCCATTTPGAREVCVLNVSRSYGFVCDSETLGAARLG